MSDDGNETLLCANEVTKYLNISYSTLLRKAKSGEIPSLRSGKHFRFKRDEIERWRQRHVEQQALLAREDLLTLDAAAALLRVGTSTLRRKVRRGEIPHIRVGRQLRFAPEEIERYLEQGAPEAAAPAASESVPDPLLDPETWWAQREATGPGPLPLHMLFTVPYEAFDRSSDEPPQFWSDGPVAVDIVRSAPKHFIVSTKRDGGQWTVAEEVENLYEARWAACDAVWNVVHAQPAAFSESFILMLHDASLYMYRRQLSEDVHAWQKAVERATG